MLNYMPNIINQETSRWDIIDTERDLKFSWFVYEMCKKNSQTGKIVINNSDYNFLV